jgi:cytochrome b6-f complex iron-sulfur subunit
MTHELTPTSPHALVEATTDTGRSGRVLRRRRVLQLAFWSGVGAVLSGAVASTVNALWPRRVDAFGGPVVVSPGAVPRPGDPPVKNIEGHFLLVNLEPGEGMTSRVDEPSRGGLLALWWKCPHLGCTVPWQDQFVFAAPDEKPRRGWFRCPCHASTYTKAGVRVYGPAPRSMDTMRIDVDATTGALTVQTGERTPGDVDNPGRAVPYTTQSP